MVVKNYNTIQPTPAPAGVRRSASLGNSGGGDSSSNEERPRSSSASQRRQQQQRRHLHLFHPAASGGENDDDTNDVALLSPYTPADYKTMAMEMAYLTPRRKQPPSVRLLSSGAGGGGGGGGRGLLSNHSQTSTTSTSAASSAGAQFFTRADSQGSTTTSEHDTLLVSGAASSSSSSSSLPPPPDRLTIIRRQSSQQSQQQQQQYPIYSPTAANPGRLTLILFAASILFLFADQNLLAPNLTAVARDFGFDDAQRDIKLGGQIPFAFFVVGGAVSVVVGPLADIFNRKNLYVWTCLVGTIPCLLTYWVQTFNQFFVLRTLTGVAVGGAFPLIYSLASDITTPDQRALASSLITISMGLGSTLGQGVAGFLGPTYGWRLPFVMIAIPSIFVISLVVLTMEEPPRGVHHHGQHGHGGGHGVHGGAQEEQIRAEERRVVSGGEEGGVGFDGDGEEEEGEEWDGEEEGEEEEEEEEGPSLARLDKYSCTVQMRKFLDVFIIKTNLLAFCQSMPGCLPWGVISAFLTDFLHEQRGMTVEGATALMFIFGLGCFAGNLAGGILGQWVYNRSKEAAAILMAATTALGFLPMAFLINTHRAISTPSGGFTLLAAVVAFSGGIAAFTGPLVRAFVMQVNSSRNRGTVFSVFMVADDLGKGLGPAIVSLLIPKWGRVTAFNISLSGWGLCALFLFLMSFTITPDDEMLQRQLQQQRQEAENGGGGRRRKKKMTKREKAELQQQQLGKVVYAPVKGGSGNGGVRRIPSVDV